jgi:hypothetical protein
MKVSRGKLVSLWQILSLVGNTPGSVKFHYSVNKNKKLLEPEVKSLEEAKKPTERFLEWEKKRLEICKELAEKDEAGQPVLVPVNGTTVFKFSDENRSLFEQKISAVRDEYEDAIKDFQDKERQFDELLREEVEIELHLIPLSAVPDTLSLTGPQTEVFTEFCTE